MQQKEFSSAANKIFSATQKRFVAISMAVVVLCMAIFSVITLFFYNLTLFSKVDSDLEGQERAVLEMMLRQPEDVPGTLPFPPVNSAGQDRPDDRKPFPAGSGQDRRVICFIYAEDSLIYLTPNPYFQEEDIGSLSLNTQEISGFSHNGEAYRGKETISGGYRMGVFTNVDSELDSLRRLLLVLAASFLLLLAVCYGMARFLTKKALAPVRESYNKQACFVQDASHEMRTPLAIIKGKTELLATNPFDKIEDHYEEISQIMSEVVSMERMNKNLLTLSKEDIDDRPVLTKFSLEKLVGEIREFFTVLAQSQEKEFLISLPSEPVEVIWDFARMKQAVLILLDNAFKYTRAGDSISLTFTHSKKSIVVCVADTGIGIERTEQKRIFDRFYRSETIRGKNIGGSGIGLSLLQSLARTLDFRISMESSPGKGSSFLLTVPIHMKP